jgi:hypothetical protein
MVVESVPAGLEVVDRPVGREDEVEACRHRQRGQEPPREIFARVEPVVALEAVEGRAGVEALVAVAVGRGQARGPAPERREPLAHDVVEADVCVGGDRSGGILGDHLEGVDGADRDQREVASGDLVDAPGSPSKRASA